MIWLDCANKQPNVGSGGIVQWELKAIGKMGHSGFPHKAINAIELASDGSFFFFFSYLLSLFYSLF